MSSQAPLCPKCSYQRGDASPEEIEAAARRRLRDKVYRLRMASYVAITVFVAGFGWYWWDTDGFVATSSTPPLVTMAVGAIAYLVVRVMLFSARYKQRHD